MYLSVFSGRWAHYPYCWKKVTGKGAKTGTAKTIPPLKRSSLSHTMSRLLADGITLKKHQEECLEWMNMREETPHKGIQGGLVYGEPGLGKTLLGLEDSLET